MSPPDSESPTSSSVEDELLELVVRCLDRMEQEGSAALEDLCSEHPQLAGRDPTTLTGRDLLEAGQAIDNFEERFGTDAHGLRFAADLRNEFVLSLRRAAAAGTDTADTADAAADAAADTAAKSETVARMHALLHRALDAGYADRDELATTPSLDSFLADPEFRELMERWGPAP